MEKTDINSMLLFLAVVDAGSFTLAAERLNMPKANLSRKVSQLEASLGITLLERTTRTQHLTEAGSVYLEHCKQIKAQIELANASVAQALNEISGELKVGMSVGMGHEILKPVLSQFMQENKQVNLQLSLLNRRVDVIEEGFDLVIRIGELADSRLVAKRLGRVSRRFYASREFIAQHGVIKTPEALANFDVLLMSSIQKSEVISLVNESKQCDVVISPRMRVDDYIVLKQMVVDGVGLAILPDYMCSQYPEKDLLEPVLAQWQLPAVEVYALYPKNRIHLPKVAAFVAFIQAVFFERLSQR
ncbi:LysR family transcriptional regulator [Pseudoalteromonas luteoviolacea]|uniref:LysR family transcriptional regulator n=1 Tax=Pseudoalteromonas luteoviolacea TaxID=43657 RepID=A0A0C1MND3_9GAMM|nr:LysR family transcriptional regulator [Pseudoalteromonas luteoviolacea]KID56013.1 LysR family transcriptional regulator [Pseudoalteromonas luteoviolacea]